MSASFRSHFRSPPPQSDPNVETLRKARSRIPTKPSSTESKSRVPQHVSQLAKRERRNIAPAEHAKNGTESTVRASTPVIAAYQSSTAASRRPSVVLRSDVHQPSFQALPGPRYTGSALPILRTPSLVSGSSISTFDGPRSALPRKPHLPASDRHAVQMRSDTIPRGLANATMHSRTELSPETFDNSVFGISMPLTSTHVLEDTLGGNESKQESSRQSHLTRNTPPIQYYAQSTTPSTRYTDSPFSHVQTPSSASSYSPSTTATSWSTARPKQLSPEQDPSIINGHDRVNVRLGLPPVRESSSSSSNSTIKPLEHRSVFARKPVAFKTQPDSIATKTHLAPHVIPGTPDTTRSNRLARPDKLPAQAPPELAHLNVDSPSRHGIHKPLPPIRPSRDGALSIADMSRPSPVVQSDLPRLYTAYHKRTPSQETPLSPSAPSPSLRSRLGLSSRSSSRQQSPRVDSAISPSPSARSFSRGPTPELPSAETRRLQRMDSPAVGPALSPSKSARFGIFARKTRSDVSKATEKPKRLPVKGPAAGTGHEGYGRFGFRGRSGSATSSTGTFRSPSADSALSSTSQSLTSRKDSLGSSKGGSELDEFLTERLTPVVLRGSGSTTSTGANVSTAETHTPTLHDPSSSSSVDSYPAPQLLPSAMQGSPMMIASMRPHPGTRKASDSSEDDVNVRFPTLAARRSPTHKSQADDKTIVGAPAFIDTRHLLPAQDFGSFDVNVLGLPLSVTQPHHVAKFKAGREGLWLQSQEADEDLSKPSQKWNFLQRAHAFSHTKGNVKINATTDGPRTEIHQAPYRAHYTMLEPAEPVDLYEVEQIMQESETSAEESTMHFHVPSKVVPYERRHGGLLPSPFRTEVTKGTNLKVDTTPPMDSAQQDFSESPELLRARQSQPRQTPHVVDIPRSPLPPTRADSDILHAVVSVASHSLNTPEMIQSGFGTPTLLRENKSPRQPRLSPVGRIPKVVSRRDHDRRMPDASFSRPFARTQPHPSVKPPGALYTQIRSSRELTSPVEPGSLPVSSTSAISDAAFWGAEHKSSIGTDPTSISAGRSSTDIQPGQQLFAFTPRKNSEASYSSSSGTASWMAALSTQSPQQDDPWTEYNDLLDDMMPLKTPLSAGSSLGRPFQYASVIYDSSSPLMPTPLSVNPPLADLPPPPRSKTVPAILSIPQQVARFMQPSMSPLTPPTTISDLISQYGDQRQSERGTPNRASLPHSKRSSNVPQPNRISLPNARSSVSSGRQSGTLRHSRTASLPEAKARNSQSSLTPSARFNHDTQLLDIAENDSEQFNREDLQYGALMTSKWLSFGRVLFSPAHNEMRLSDDPKVLVIDGLGSDWSSYVAASYPTAHVYNLGPAVINGSTSWPGSNQEPLPNHRQIPHSKISAAFPFPKGFFTAVVFRFPSVTTDAAYHACIFECKRVLKPGGHLEVAVLDLDLVNMGSTARGLVRGLKTRLQQHDQDVSLGNLSDVLIRLIGRRGFEGIQRCVVGVPATGRIPRSEDMSNSGSAGDISRPHRSLRHSNGKKVSFADLLETARHGQVEPTQSHDEGITKMVAKVGRWWYSSCYETPLLHTDRSIWDNPSLLQECETQGTSFRLLICYAQKPLQAQRRTVSV